MAGMLAAAASLAGCVVGPTYRAPPPPSGTTAPLISLAAPAQSAAAPPDDWWRLYNDPKLDAYVREAFAANTDLAIAEANLAAARAALQAAQAGLYPSTDLRFASVYGRDPGTNEILALTGRKPFTLWVFSALFDVSYELDMFGRVRRSVEAANADSEAVAAARDAVKITVAAETARAYAQICAVGAQIAVARRNLAVVSREAEITVNRLRAGAGSEFELVRAETLVAQVRSTIPPLEGQRRSALFQLAALLGRTPANAPREAEACVEPPALSIPMPVGDGAALVKRRPDVREAERRLAGATARIGVATAALYPQITLTGAYGGISPDLSTLTNVFGLAWGVGPHIRWTFPNQTLPRAQLQQAEAGQRAALANFDGTILKALRETEQALAAYGAELERDEYLRLAQAKARRTYELAHGQFLAGATSQLDLLTAEQTLVSAEASVAASASDLVQDQIVVFKALGGGWSSGAGSPMAQDQTGGPAVAASVAEPATTGP
jgi:NodT family efflux transporter outer membrane factor (OMF) lipoprotein